MSSYKSNENAECDDLLIDFKLLWSFQRILKFDLTCHVTMFSLVLIHWGSVQKSMENVNKRLRDKCLVWIALSVWHCVNKTNFTISCLQVSSFPRKPCVWPYHCWKQQALFCPFPQAALRPLALQRPSSAERLSSCQVSEQSHLRGRRGRAASD